MKERLGKIYVWAGSFTVLAAFFLLLLSISAVSLPGISNAGSGLFSSSWNPAKGDFSIWPSLFGTLTVTFIALIIAVPLGMFCGIYIAEVLPARYRLATKSILEILAGIPSVVYGLIGITLVSVFIKDLFALSIGTCILSAALVLAVMVLPTIITLSDDAFHEIPQRYRDSALGLGLTRSECIMSSLLPIARPRLQGAVLLAFGRAIGETMAVMMIIGSIDRIPKPFFNILEPGQTITSKLGRELSEADWQSVHFGVLVGLSFILLTTVLIFSFLSQRFTEERRLVE